MPALFFATVPLCRACIRHPDSHQGASKIPAEAKFKELQAAYQFLSEPGALRSAARGEQSSASSSGSAPGARRAGRGDARVRSQQWWSKTGAYGAASRAGYNPHQSYMRQAHWYEDVAAVRKVIEDKLYQEFYNEATKDLPPRMQPRQRPNLQHAANADWDGWQKWELMQPGWKGIKIHSECVINADTLTEVRSAWK